MYTPNNLPLFLAAFGGALSGIGAGGRAPTDPNPLSSSSQLASAVASAFAQAFDTQWGASAPSQLAVDTTRIISAEAWTERSATSTNPGDYTNWVRALIALVREGDTYNANINGVNSPATSGWTLALDIDFTAQPSQPLNPDGVYTIGGLPWTKINSAQDADGSPMTLTNGLGLVVVPKTTAFFLGVFTMPALTLDPALIIPKYDHFTSIRQWTYYSLNSASAQGVGGVSGIANLGTNTGFLYQQQWDSGAMAAGFCFSNNGVVFQNALSPAPGSNIIEGWIPEGNAGGYGNGLSGKIADGFPPDPKTLLLAGEASFSDASNQFFGLSSAWRFFVGAGRNGQAAGTANVRIARTRIEYKYN